MWFVKNNKQILEQIRVTVTKAPSPGLMQPLPGGMGGVQSGWAEGQSHSSPCRCLCTVCELHNPCAVALGQNHYCLIAFGFIEYIPSSCMLSSTYYLAHSMISVVLYKLKYMPL